MCHHLHMRENIPSGKKMIVSATEFMIENILPVASHPFHQSILRLRFECARLRSTFMDMAWHLRWIPRKRKKCCGSKRGNGGGQKKREDSLRESSDSGVRASVWKGFRQQVSSGAERWKSRVGIYHPKNLGHAHTSLATNQSIKRGRGLYRRRCGLNSFIG